MTSYTSVYETCASCKHDYLSNYGKYITIYAGYRIDDKEVELESEIVFYCNKCLQKVIDEVDSLD